MKKIKDIDYLSEEQIKSGANFYDVEREIARIDGDKYPMFYAKVINKMLEDELPFLLFLGKPGTGKTVAASRLGYDFTEEIEFFDGEYDPEQNIHYKNIDFMEELLQSRGKVLHKPDINATLKAVDHHKDSNRAFESFIHLSRIFGNLITGDAQFLWRCDTGIQITHTFRLVATPNASQYAFDVYYVERKPDEEKKEVEVNFIQRWEPEKPPKDLMKYIEKHDEKNKKEILEEALQKAKEEEGEAEEDSEFEVA